jgi:uncharacterized repeat protein (TIGR03803 family)
MPDGSSPSAAVIFDKSGDLYGTTTYGGSVQCTSSSGCGAIYKLSPPTNSGGAWAESIVHNFTGADGYAPASALVFDATGNLYGTASQGGATGQGTTFKLTPESAKSWTATVLLSFDYADGINPTSKLTFDKAGSLYGTTEQGGGIHSCSGFCGLVFKLTPQPDGSWKDSTIHSFADTPTAYPVGGVIFDAAGNLYGNTWGYSGDGAAFRMTPAANGNWAFSILHTFAGDPATNPADTLVLDKTGNLYGVTTYCGSGKACSGVVFEIRQ